MRSKLNSIEKIIYNALTDYAVNHEEFTLVIKEEQIYLGLKESIRTKDSQRRDLKSYRLIEHSQRNGIYETLE